MPKTGKVSTKRYQCSDCGHQLTANTNHFGEFYDRCPKCSWKSPMDPVKTFVCLEELPEGWTKPEPWNKVSLEVVVLNGHPVKKGKAMNDCDYGHPTPHEVRLLPTGGGENVILCRPHFLKEIAFRKERNETLPPEDHFSLPRWEELNVYDPS